MDFGVLITAGIGIVTTFFSGFFTWLFSKRKYNAEADSSEIDNLKKSMKLYQELLEDCNKKLQFYITMSEENRIEVFRLRDIVYRLLNNSCLLLGCEKRQFYTEDQIRDILGETLSVNIKTNEANS